MSAIVVVALYKFVSLEDYQALRQPLLDTLMANGVKGTLLLAREGINGTVAGPRDGMDAVLAWLRSDSRLSDLDYKESLCDEMPFYRTKVKLKKEIVTLGVDGISPTKRVGTYVEPQDWNALISDPEVLLIDTRNDYEVEIGTFEGAIDPQTKSFREFPDWWRENAPRFHNKRVAMFCTGGIRCEKATNFLISEGVSDVYHLKGGILKYLEDMPAEGSLWNGDCFVFDNRVSLRHGLEVGDYESCYACRRPVSAQDKQHTDYEKGVSCHRCIAEFTDADRARFREREHQMRLAEERGEAHLGRS